MFFYRGCVFIPNYKTPKKTIFIFSFIVKPETNSFSTMNYFVTGRRCNEHEQVSFIIVGVRLCDILGKRKPEPQKLEKCLKSNTISSQNLNFKVQSYYWVHQGVMMSEKVCWIRLNIQKILKYCKTVVLTGCHTSFTQMNISYLRVFHFM